MAVNKNILNRHKLTTVSKTKDDMPIRLRMQLGMLSKSYLISLNLLATAM